MAPSLSTAKPPSTRDIISWQQEEAHRLGLLGFSTNFPNPSDIFQPISLQRSAQIAPDTDDAAVAVAAAMQQTHNALYLLHHRRSIMDAHRAAVSRTELDVDAKLLAEGMSKLYVARHGLREKLVALVECKQPRAEKNFVTVQVQPRGVNGWIELALPLKATMAEVNQLLGEVVSAEMARLREWMKEDGGEGRRGGWKYQLLSHDRSRVVSHRSVELETDADFTRLSLILDDGCGKARPVAVLTQVSKRD